MELAPGQQLGTYRILRLLGQGGMGAVYEVEHTQLGVHYALKTFAFSGGHDELLKNKFLAEGRVLARLNDPHLVRVFDLNFDEATGTLYFVMDLVLYKDGQPRTLADVETAELDEDFVLQWFGELASALDYIHAQGIVHRDIKLGNVLLNAEGRVILSDFGVSRFFSQNLRKEIDAVTTMVSEAGTGGRLVMGTQGYMAPEVARGEEATPAADAYSLGVMLVYLLTGIWYAPGSKVFRLLETLEYNWKDILPRLLAENPADRPTNLSELVEVVRRVAAPVGAFLRNAQDAFPPSVGAFLRNAQAASPSSVGAFLRNAQDAFPPSVGAFLRNAPQGDSRESLLMRISEKCAHGWRGTVALAAALLAIAAAGYFVFSYRAASTTPIASAVPAASTVPIVPAAPAASAAPIASTTPAASPAVDVFDTAFGTSGIYVSPKK